MQKQDDWDNYDLKDDFSQSNSYETSNSFYPQDNIKDSGTFKIRTDPSQILEDFRLQLMNAYKSLEEIKDETDGSIKKVTKIRFKKNTTPRANKQGVEDIISYVQKYVNNHTVQGNIEDRNQFNNMMREISNNLTMHFHTQRVFWGIKINDIDTIISNAIDLIDIFLTRTLYGEERKLYGETFKENTQREFKPEQKANWIQKLGGFFSGGGRKR